MGERDITAELARMDKAFADVEAKRAAAQAVLDAQGRGKAAQFLAGPKCVVCGRAMATRSNGDRHFLCDQRSIVGRSCTCPSGCTDRHISDSPTIACDPECQPCRINRGQPAKLKDK